ncbi:MAG: acyl transferase [Bacteroidota bacterium]
MALFRYQAEHVPVYRQYLTLLNKSVADINTVEQIPFLPIELFKGFEVVSEDNKKQAAFTSSGTSGVSTSKHWVDTLEWYEHSFFQAFDLAYPDHQNAAFLGLLPGYLEREGSSLIYMVKELMGRSDSSNSAFVLDDYELLEAKLLKAQDEGEKVVIIGVTFGILDWLEKRQIGALKGCVIMETGGMKGRRKEMTRDEVHEVIKEATGVEAVHSEYGMTELLSQAYSFGNGIFQSPPWMKVLIRETSDPFHVGLMEKTGGLNVIDLANAESCAFIATQDLGKQFRDGTFQVLGRFDHAEIRGCNLMVAE